MRQTNIVKLYLITLFFSELNGIIKNLGGIKNSSDLHKHCTTDRDEKLEAVHIS